MQFNVILSTCKIQTIYINYINCIIIQPTLSLKYEKNKSAFNFITLLIEKLSKELFIG